MFYITVWHIAFLYVYITVWHSTFRCFIVTSSATFSFTMWFYLQLKSSNSHSLKSWWRGLSEAPKICWLLCLLHVGNKTSCLDLNISVWHYIPLIQPIYTFPEASVEVQQYRETAHTSPSCPIKIILVELNQFSSNCVPRENCRYAMGRTGAHALLPREGAGWPRWMDHSCSWFCQNSANCLSLLYWLMFAATRPNPNHEYD